MPVTSFLQLVRAGTAAKLNSKANGQLQGSHGIYNVVRVTRMLSCAFANFLKTAGPCIPSFYLQTRYRQKQIIYVIVVRYIVIYYLSTLISHLIRIILITYRGFPVSTYHVNMSLNLLYQYDKVKVHFRLVLYNFESNALLLSALANNYSLR